MPFKLIVGLGNPGSEYADTRHNMGFMFIERFLKTHRPERWEYLHTCESNCYVGKVGRERVILQMPQTFMNASGSAVAKLMRREEIDPAEVLVVYDDMDLPVGRLRIRKNGASGGHHGIDSIIEELNGNSNFARVRLGIGRGEDTIDHVLSKFSAAETPAVEACLETACKAVDLAMHRDLGKAMNEYNGWVYVEAVEETAEKETNEARN